MESSQRFASLKKGDSPYRPNTLFLTGKQSGSQYEKAHSRSQAAWEQFAIEQRFLEMLAVARERS